MTLARIEGAPPGGAGLSVFLVTMRDRDGSLRNIRVERLKDKLGTRALPTAELTLEGTPARLIGGTGDGIKKISTLFNITRVYNAVAAVSGMRRAIALATDYAKRRTAFGRPLIEQPLHVETLAELSLRFRACFLLAFRVIELLGKEECGEASDGELQLLRLLTPVAKLYTAKQAVTIASEVVESFGGAGYVEDTGIPRLLRDAQVLPIWEGTTNVLSLDTLRAIQKTDALAAWIADVRRRAGRSGKDELAAKIESAVGRIESSQRVAEKAGGASQQAAARGLAYSIARTEAAMLLHEQAQATSDAAAVVAAKRWGTRELVTLVDADDDHLAGSRQLVD
jgi:hypothetical protein